MQLLTCLASCTFFFCTLAGSGRLRRWPPPCAATWDNRGAQTGNGRRGSRAAGTRISPHGSDVNRTPSKMQGTAVHEPSGGGQHAAHCHACAASPLACLDAVCQRNQAHICRGQRVDVASGPRKLDNCAGRAEESDGSSGQQPPCQGVSRLAGDGRAARHIMHAARGHPRTSSGSGCTKR